MPSLIFTNASLRTIQASPYWLPPPRPNLPLGPHTRARAHTHEAQAAFARLWGLVDGNIDPVGGWPTALQWLIEFCEGYIQTGAEFGWPVTSPGTGGNNSLVRYAGPRGGVSQTPFPVGSPLFARFVHSDEGRALLALTGHDVPFMVGRIRGAQLASMRPSYVNALLIQSRGWELITECDECADKRRRTGSPSPFPICSRAPGHFDGACGNCKFQDHGFRCSVRDGTGNRNRTRRAAALLARSPLPQSQLAIGTAANPVDLDDDDDVIIID
ncbi:hypothetical protein N7445_001394 [Penicillium cf. griseofulvum]|nr:hypothetical protein N7445_001394 [Penicillium cf. griseofulvum]